MCASDTPENKQTKNDYIKHTENKADKLTTKPPVCEIFQYFGNYLY